MEGFFFFFFLLFSSFFGWGNWLWFCAFGVVVWCSFVVHLLSFVGGGGEGDGEAKSRRNGQCRAADDGGEWEGGLAGGRR